MKKAICFILILSICLISAYGGVRLIHDVFGTPESRILKMVEMLFVLSYIFGFNLWVVISADSVKHFIKNK